MTNACRTLRLNCIDGIEANEERLAAMVASSVGVITALIPVIGYEAAAKLAKHALASGAPIRDLVVDAGLMSAQEVDAALAPEKLSNSKI
jgi:aspartate ammonia-lyase